MTDGNFAGAAQVSAQITLSDTLGDYYHGGLLVDPAYNYNGGQLGSTPGVYNVVATSIAQLDAEIDAFTFEPDAKLPSGSSDQVTFSVAVTDAGANLTSLASTTVSVVTPAAGASTTTATSTAAPASTVAPATASTVVLSAITTAVTVVPNEGAVSVQGAGVTGTILVTGADYGEASIFGNQAGFNVGITGTTISAGNVGNVQFIDGTSTFSTASAQAQILRMYQAALGRSAVLDPQGFAYWTQQLLNGTSLTAIAQGFLGSQEFATNYQGSSNPSTFITDLYANVLNRAPDAGGLQNWLTALAGGMTKAQVLTSFSESTENVISTSSQVTNGLFVTSEDSAEVARLYLSTLSVGGINPASGGSPRYADLPGLTYWTNNLESGAMTLQQVAAGFTNSAEFAATYGPLSNSQFVTVLYGNVLGRAPDSGSANYVNALNVGAQTRAQVTLSFSESQEFKNDSQGVIYGGIKLAS